MDRGETNHVLVEGVNHMGLLEQSLVYNRAISDFALGADKRGTSRQQPRCTPKRPSSNDPRWIARPARAQVPQTTSLIPIGLTRVATRRARTSGQKAQWTRHWSQFICPRWHDAAIARERRVQAEMTVFRSQLARRRRLDAWPPSAGNNDRPWWAAHPRCRRRSPLDHQSDPNTTERRVTLSVESQGHFSAEINSETVVGWVPVAK